MLHRKSYQSYKINSTKQNDTRSKCKSQLCFYTVTGDNLKRKLKTLLFIRAYNRINYLVKVKCK